ncbi:MAG: hypothetical protein ACE5GR_04990 [Nitrosopumilus sp.]
MKTIRIAIFALVALMLSASSVYFVQAYEETNEEDSDEENEIETLTDNDEISTENDEETELPEAAFFSLVGLAYVPVSGWMILKKHTSKKPYVIALIGSLVMIVFYVLTRTIDLPIIGLQTDVGLTDTTAKILQIGAVGFSGFLIYKIEKLRKK